MLDRIRLGESSHSHCIDTRMLLVLALLILAEFWETNTYPDPNHYFLFFGRLLVVSDWLLAALLSE